MVRVTHYRASYSSRLHLLAIWTTAAAVAR
jgi:hypothetical protein